MRFLNSVSVLFLGLVVANCGSVLHAAGLKTENVFLIVSDGFRWQEVFNGADERMLSKDSGGVRNTNKLREEFWRATPEERRRALLPFFWDEIARNGQLLGNQTRGSVVTVTNGKKFSYPGYNEMSTGFGDPRVDSNDKKLNLNTNVFEWLNNKRRFHGKVSILGTWEVFPYIFNCERSRLPIWPAWTSNFASLEIPVPPMLTQLMQDTTSTWTDITYDSFLIQAATAHVKQKKPRVTFVGFGETDEWAHARRYDLYLETGHRVDGFVRRLWETTQSMPQYRGKTTFIVTCDHGRGAGPEDWTSHGEKVPGAEGIWLAVLGPDTPPLGERTQAAPQTQSQIAATIAALLGEDFHAAFPNSGAPLSDLIK